MILPENQCDPPETCHLESGEIFLFLHGTDVALHPQLGISLGFFQRFLILVDDNV